MQSQKFTINKSNELMWQHNVFFWLRHLSPSQQSLYHRQPYVNGVAVTETAEAYSNIQDGTSSKNSNVIDLLTIFTKSPIPDTWSGPDFISGRWRKYL